MSRSKGKKWARWLLGLVLAAGGGVATVAWGQGPPTASPAEKRPLPEKSFMNKNPFFLPVSLDDRLRASLQEIQLYVKNEASQPWMFKDKITPTKDCFTFKAPRDGEYWFALVTVDKSGKASALEDAPAQIVVLDTQPPQVEVAALPATPDGPVVKVDVRDPHLDASRTQFSYQTGNRAWHAVDHLANHPDQFCIPRQAVLTGMIKVVSVDYARNEVSREFNLSTLPVAGVAPFPVAVSPRAHDLAVETSGPKSADKLVPVLVEDKNTMEPPPLSGAIQRTPAPLPGAFEKVEVLKVPGPTVGLNPIQPVEIRLPAAAGIKPVPSVNPIPVEPAVKSLEFKANASLPVNPVSLNKQIVNNTHLFLDYQIEQMGASGVGKVEIWMSRDKGQTWQKHGEDTDRKSPAELDLPGEGEFGITLVVTNGRGFGGLPPVSGDTPDWWVELDVTKPHVEIVGVRPGSIDESGALHISWTARDKNLGQAPIDLFYAVERNGPWHPIAKGLRNEGHYRWNVPGDLGPHAYIRLVAIDQAGNAAHCETAQAVALDDLSRPRARVFGISTSAPKTLPRNP